MFNKISKIFFAATSLALVMVACTKEVNEDIISPRSEVKFATSDTGRANNPKVFFVKDEPNQVWRIPVGFTTVSDQDRTIEISYNSPSGAAQGVQFTGPTTVTIPAGQASDTIEVQGLFAGFAGNRVDTFMIKVTSPGIPSSTFASTYHLVMRPYCEVILPDLEGIYDDTRESFTNGSSPYGPYTTVIKNLALLPGETTKAEGYIENIYNDGWQDIRVLLDWTSPSNFIATIPLQATGNGYNVRSHSGKANTFSSCDETFTFTIQLVDPGGAILLEDYVVKIKQM